MTAKDDGAGEKLAIGALAVLLNSRVGMAIVSAIIGGGVTLGAQQAVMSIGDEDVPAAVSASRTPDCPCTRGVVADAERAIIDAVRESETRIRLAIADLKASGFGRLPAAPDP